MNETKTSAHEVLHPKNWKAAQGFANGIAAEGRLVFLAGQIGWNAEQQFESDDFIAQTRQALSNIVTLVQEAGGQVEHIVRLTWFVTEKKEYLARAARTRSGLSRGAGPALPGDDFGSSRGAGRGSRQGRDRGDGGHSEVSVRRLCAADNFRWRRAGHPASPLACP